MGDRERTAPSTVSEQDGGGAELYARSADDPVYWARRLTPTECAALQGFPADWAADIPHTDSQEYKMWGNGIALPCLLPMMKAMADELDFSKHMNPPEEETQPSEALNDLDYGKE